MYNSSELAIVIKDTARRKGIVIGEMLKACELGVNTISHLKHGKSIAFDSLAKIADYLDVSVDYLLGRTERQESVNNYSQIIDNTKFENSIVNNGNTEVSGTQTTKGNDRTQGGLDETTVELISIFQKLKLGDKAKVMSLVAELYDEDN